jgi:hypothetical protein
MNETTVPRVTDTTARKIVFAYICRRGSDVKVAA